MLQALKNLESRTPRPTVKPASSAAGRPAEKKTVSPSDGRPERQKVDAGRAITPSVTAPLGPSTSEDGATCLIRPARRADAPPASSTPATTVYETLQVGVAGSISPLPPSLEEKRAEGVIKSPAIEIPHPGAIPTGERTNNPAATAPMRPATSFERLIGRTLNDPVSVRPLRELGELLRRDLEQTGSRTVAIVGVGEMSVVHETIAYAARLLAEKLTGRALMVDGDLSRRALTAALEYDQEPGLAELLSGEQPTSNRFQLTATANVLFLPAGRVAQADLSASRVEPLLQQLGEEFACVLIDAGRTRGSAAATLARVADATYFVVRLGAVETSEAQAALRDLRAAGARVLGAIAT
jgi:Mrp family chromosome partitioning ATPase